MKTPTAAGELQYQQTAPKTDGALSKVKVQNIKLKHHLEPLSGASKRLVEPLSFKPLRLNVELLSLKPLNLYVRPVSGTFMWTFSPWCGTLIWNLCAEPLRGTFMWSFYPELSWQTFLRNVYVEPLFVEPWETWTFMCNQRTFKSGTCT